LQALPPRWLAVPWIAVAALAAVTWVVTVMPARDMGNGPGTRGLAPLPSVGLWVVMMAATMLPFRAASASSTPKSPAALQPHRCQQPPDPAAARRQCRYIRLENSRPMSKS